MQCAHSCAMPRNGCDGCSQRAVRSKPADRQPLGYREVAALCDRIRSVPREAAPRFLDSVPSLNNSNRAIPQESTKCCALFRGLVGNPNLSTCLEKAWGNSPTRARPEMWTRRSVGRLQTCQRTPCTHPYELIASHNLSCKVVIELQDFARITVCDNYSLTSSVARCNFRFYLRTESFCAGGVNHVSQCRAVPLAQEAQHDYPDRGHRLVFG